MLKRFLLSTTDEYVTDWMCSHCGWKKPVPRFAEDVGEPSADVRAEFSADDCAKSAMSVASCTGAVKKSASSEIVLNSPSASNRAR